MLEKKLATEAYKGVRDFYPEDAAVERYIFDTWSKTAETFGFARYDASILEPAELYKAKGAENEELVNEQTYTFIDRGDREVTLRPEMTPTVARMVAAKRRELSFPLRWYAIPNLFRYERPQRGRLREHWQLNCDIFGGDSVSADIELVALARQLLIDFGATPELFEIRINNRAEMGTLYTRLGINDPEIQNQITRLNDRYHKISQAEYETLLSALVPKEHIKEILTLVASTDADMLTMPVMNGLNELGITNVKIDRSLARGFNYYTGTIFEIFDVSGKNPRAMLGGGRYDNLTQMFSDEPLSGVGFGMGDVTMRDFLETHALLPATLRKAVATLMIIPTDTAQNLEALKIAQLFRQREVKTAVDTSTKKLGKKIADAAESGVSFALIVGEDERSTGQYTLKNLSQNTSETNTLTALLTNLIAAL